MGHKQGISNFKRVAGGSLFFVIRSSLLDIRYSINLESEYPTPNKKIRITEVAYRIDRKKRKGLHR